MLNAPASVEAEGFSCRGAGGVTFSGGERVYNVDFYIGYLHHTLSLYIYHSAFCFINIKT